MKLFSNCTGQIEIVARKKFLASQTAGELRERQAELGKQIDKKKRDLKSSTAIAIVRSLLPDQITVPAANKKRSGKGGRPIQAGWKRRRSRRR